MHRRTFLKTTALSTVAAVTAGVTAACSTQLILPTRVPSVTNTPTAAAQTQPAFDWQMAISYPATLDTLFGGAQHFAERVAVLTNGNLKITPRPPGELAPATGVLDVVSAGTVPMGYTASYYYISKSPVMNFGTAMPFGLTAQQQNAWLYDGGGLDLLQEFYREQFGLIQFPIGNTGTQMGGWFRKEIKTLDDLQGLKMRIPGLGGQVMSRLGVTTTSTPAPKFCLRWNRVKLDAAEWTGPYDDEKLGLAKAAPYYYYPGWWEPGATVEIQINLDRWNELPAEYQDAVRTAAGQTNLETLSLYEARNAKALPRLVAAGVKLTPFSKEILDAAQATTNEIIEEYYAQDADFKRIWEEWRTFRDAVRTWNKLNEFSFANYVYGAS